MPQGAKIRLREFRTATIRAAVEVLIFVTLISCFSTVAAAQGSAQPTSQSIITGRVLFADTGRPVRRATVSLYTNLNYPPVRTTPANQRGEFRFTEVAPGSYFVIAQARGIVYPLSSFAITNFGLSGSNIETQQTRVTADGKNTSRCELRVARAGTIQGVMTYADKEPVLNGRIMLFRRKGGVVTPFFLLETVMTNDRGMYRIDGLPDGEFFVGLVIRKGMADVDLPRGLNGIPTAYYPGVKSIREAKGVVIESGATVSNVNITLDDDDNLRQISGVVKWRHSDAPTRAAVTVRRKDEPNVDVSMSSLFRSMTAADTDREDTMMRDMGLMMMTLPPIIETGEDGEWLVEDLPPGTYLITAYAQLSKSRKQAKTNQQPEDELESSGGLYGDRMVSKQVEVVVGEEDRKNITIELTEGGRVLGFVTGPDGSPAPPVALSIQSLNTGGDFLLNLPQFSKQDGTFLLEGVPAGQVQLDVDLSKPGFYLKSITLGGQDLLREPLVMTEGAEVTNVRITVASDPAKLSGRVQVKEDGSPAGGAGVLLVKADPKLWHLQSSRFFAAADANGMFEMRCPPGDYVVITWPAGGQPVQDVEGFVRSQAPAARTVSLQSKEEKQIELTLAPPRK